MAELISDKQLALNRKLHEADPAFGSRDAGSGLARRLPLALTRMQEMGLFSSVLDYGTGKGLLWTDCVVCCLIPFKLMDMTMH